MELYFTRPLSLSLTCSVRTGLPDGVTEQERRALALDFVRDALLLHNPTLRIRKNRLQLWYCNHVVI